MLLGRELLDVLRGHEHPGRDVLAGLIEMLVKRGDVTGDGHASEPRPSQTRRGDQDDAAQSGRDTRSGFPVMRAPDRDSSVSDSSNRASFSRNAGSIEHLRD